MSTPQRREVGCLCGAGIFWQRTDDAQLSSVAAGISDEPTGLRTVAQIFTATPGDYYASMGEGKRQAQGLGT